MIHHLARAFLVRDLVRDAALQQAALHHTSCDARNLPEGGDNKPLAPQTPAAKPVKPRPITPWSTTPARPVTGGEGRGKVVAMASAPIAAARRVRISTDPSDARRTVIAGRFAEVCAALDRLVREQEAAA